MGICYSISSFTITFSLGGVNLNNNGEEHNHQNHMNHDNHASHHHGNFKVKFFVSLIFAIPIILLSPLMGVNLPFQFTFPGSEWVVLILSTILFFYGGKPFLSGGKDEIATKKPGMMTLVTLGISVAYIYSLYAFYMNNFSSATGHTMDFFWELATLILIMLLGHWIEMNAVGNAGDALKKMAELLPNSALKVMDNGQREEVKISDIMTDDIVEVKAGESIPTDGIIVQGQTSIDESLVTGESKKVQKIKMTTSSGVLLMGLEQYKSRLQLWEKMDIFLKLWDLLIKHKMINLVLNCYLIKWRVIYSTLL